MTPRERLHACGPGALSDAELLTVLFRHGESLTAAERILAQTGGLQGLVTTDGDLLKRCGVSSAKAAVMLSCAEITRRITKGHLTSSPVLCNPERVATYVSVRFAQPDQEVVGALFLDVQHHLCAERELFRGTLTHALVEPRQVLREALGHRAASFILFHTHPSGDPSASADDVQFTHRLRHAATIVGVRFLDHLIVGSGGAFHALSRDGLL